MLKITSQTPLDLEGYKQVVVKYNGIERQLKYYINKNGDLISFKRVTPFFMNRQTDGYNNPYYQIMFAGKRRHIRIKKLVYGTFVKPIEDCNRIIYKDNNPQNCHVDNLEYVCKLKI